jgi:hypothetical protein
MVTAVLPAVGPWAGVSPVTAGAGTAAITVPVNWLIAGDEEELRVIVNEPLL